MRIPRFREFQASGSKAADNSADCTMASRVTARRYLEYLATEGMVQRGVRYGGSGRPEVEYRWVGA